MKSPLKKIAAAFLVALVGLIPTSFAQTATITAADVFPADIDISFELNTSVTNPLEDLFRSELSQPDNELSTLLFSIADNNKVSLAMNNLSDYSNEEMYLAMNITAEDFTKLVEVSKATESETYGGIKIYKMEEDAYIAMEKNLLVVANTPENLRKTIDNSLGKTSAIGTKTAYKSVKSHDVAKNFFGMYMDPAIFMEYLGEEMGQDTISIETMAKNGVIFAGLIGAMDGEGISVNRNDTGFGFGVAVHADSSKLAEIGYVMNKYNFNPSLYQLLSGKGLMFYQERTNMKGQYEDLLGMIEMDETSLAELNTFKTDFKTETLIDFDKELLPLLTGKYMVTVHNADQVLPGVTAIFKVSDTDKAGSVMLKLSEYLEKKLQEEQAKNSAKIYDSEIESAGGTSFYGFTVYLKAFDDSGDMSGVTDEAATLHIRMAVTTDGYMVISTLPDLNAMFRKGSSGLLDNAGLKSAFTNPTSTSNEVVYLDIDSLSTYVGVLMNIFDATGTDKEEVSAAFSPWHNLFMRGESSDETAWVTGQLNVDAEKLGDLGNSIGLMMDSFGSAFDTGISTDYAPDLTYDTDMLTSFGFEKTFCDVHESDWFYPYVSDLSSKMIISGYEDGCFRPNQPVTRAEFVKMAMKAIGTAPAINSTYQPFSDVPPIYGEWYSEDINMSSMMGYVSGYDDGTFRPGNTITRAEAIQILYNMSDIVLQSVDMSSIPAENLNAFSDVRSTDWFYAPVITSYWYGVISGPGAFEPNRNLNRAEAAKIISVLWELEQNSTLPRSTHD